VVRIHSPRPIPFNSLPKIWRRNPGTQRAKVSGLIFWLAAQWIGFQETPAPRPAEKTRGNWAHQLVHTSCGRPLGVTGKRDNSGYASATLSSVRLQLFSQHRWQEKTRSASRIAKGGRTCSPGWNNAEAASVLKTLLARHSELRPETEAIARDSLTQISLFSVADDVETAVLQYDYDDLNGRAGGHSWGYVEPTEAAWELLGRSSGTLRRRNEALPGNGTRRTGVAILPGRPARPVPRPGWPGQRHPGLGRRLPCRGGRQYARCLDVGSRNRRTRRSSQTKAACAAPPGFVREHLPDWGWLLKPAAGD
jgi:hypothetical protein